MSDQEVAIEPGGQVSSGPTEYVVRCGSMRILGVMKARESYRYGDEVVVRSDRGTEIGTVLVRSHAGGTWSHG